MGLLTWLRILQKVWGLMRILGLGFGALCLEVYGTDDSPDLPTIPVKAYLNPKSM